jgi:hypothetical protein
LKYVILIFEDDFVWTPTAATGLATGTIAVTGTVFNDDYINGKFKAILIDTGGIDQVDFDLGVISPRIQSGSFKVI